MIRFLIRRILSVIPALWLIVTMVFLLAHIVPGDPVQQMLGEGARASDVAQLRHALGLDLPLLAQYRSYLLNGLHGNLGMSLHFREPVTRIVLQRFPATLELALAALLSCVAIAFPAGLLAAQRPGTAIDRTVSIFTLAGLSIPNFALGPLLIVIFSVVFGWLPVSGRGGLSHLILPAITMGLALAAILTRIVRAAVIEELSRDYVRTARAKGLSESAVLVRHALRNGFTPHSHGSRPPVRRASRRSHCYRDYFFMAGDRTVGGTSNRSAGLFTPARVHPADGHILCGGEPFH